MIDPDRLEPMVLRYREDEAQRVLVPGTHVRTSSACSGVITAHHPGRDLPYEVVLEGGVHDFFAWYMLDVLAPPPDQSYVPRGRPTLVQQRQQLETIHSHTCPQHHANARLLLNPENDAEPARDSTGNLQFHCLQCNHVFRVNDAGTIVGLSEDEA